MLLATPADMEGMPEGGSTWDPGAAEGESSRAAWGSAKDSPTSPSLLAISQQERAQAASSEVLPDQSRLPSSLVGPTQGGFSMLMKCPSEGSTGFLQADDSVAAKREDARGAEAGSKRSHDTSAALVRSHSSGTPAVTPRHTFDHAGQDPFESTAERTLQLAEDVLVESSAEKAGKALLEPQHTSTSRAAGCSLGILESAESCPRWPPSSSSSIFGLIGKPSLGRRDRRLPSRQEVHEVVPLLDMNKDGKIWEDDLDMLVQLAFHADVSSAPASWKNLKQALQSIDGLISVAPLQTAVKIGLVHKEAEKMRPLSARGARRLGFKGPQAKGFWGPFRSLRSYLEAFNKFDRDRNGVICARDLKMASCLLVGLSLGLPECRDLIRRVDANWNGVVDLLEFGALVDLLMSVFPDFEALAHVLTTDMSTINLASVAAFLSLDVSELDVLMRSAIADFVEVFIQLQQASKLV